jgi:hypothetical protein
MAFLVTQLFPPTVLTGATTTIYTVPATPTTNTLKNGRARFTNTDVAAHAVTAYAIQSGGVAGSANCFLEKFSIASGTYLDIDLPVLGPGGFYQAFADITGMVTMFQLDGILFS